jgi:hypothetical protein
MAHVPPMEMLKNMVRPFSKLNGINILGSCAKMMKMINVSEESIQISEFDARVGLCGSTCLWKFPCLLDEEH